MNCRRDARQEEFERYADFGQEVYRGNPWWRAPHREHHIAEVSGQVPQAAYSDIQRFGPSATAGSPPP